MRWCHARALVAGCLLASPQAHAKVTSGRVHLSGVKTESTLVKFAVSRGAGAKIDLNITSYGMYEDEQQLRFRVYTDDEWPEVKRMTLCSDKVTHGARAVPIVLDYVRKAPRPKETAGPGKKKGEMLELYSARLQMVVPNPPNLQKMAERPRYFYFTIDDCSLERFSHDNKIPDMFYTISVLNVRPSSSSSGGPVYDHLPADQEGMGFLLALTIGISGTLAMLLFFKFVGNLGGEVHVAILVVLAACLTNGLSAGCELLHRAAFSYNGRGNYAIDALSSYFESLSDGMIALILLSIGGGWTLPADLVGGGLSPAASGNRIVNGVKTPAGSIGVAGAILLVHVGLAQWGRTFDDDFDTYHALEHPPGRALMILRFVLGLIFITGVGVVRSGGRCPPSLMSFLTKFGLVGLSYFASLPGISMFVGSVLPYHQRHQALQWGAMLVQVSCLASLTWLFTGNSDASAYHKLSRVGKNAGGGLTESIAAQPDSGRRSGPSMWCIGKTKIRLD